MRYLFCFLFMWQFSSFAQRTVEVYYQPNIEKITLYSGVDFTDRNLAKKRAIEKKNTTQATTNHIPNLSVHSYILANNLSSTSSWDVNLKGKVSMPWATVKGDDSYTKNSTENSSSFKLRIVIQSIYSPELINDNPDLTSEASALKSHTAEFLRRFGTYFCSAVYKGHFIIIDISLSNTYNTTLETFFHSGDISVPLEVIDIGVQDRIKHDVQSTANASSAALDIETIGGPEVSDYKNIVDAMKSTSDFTSLYGFLKDLIGKFNYDNAKTIECTLSDYSTWGIEAPSLVREDIQLAESRIRDLIAKADKDINNIRSVFQNAYTNKFYSEKQLEESKSQNDKLNDLHNNLYTALIQLHYGDVTYLKKMAGYELTYIKIHKDIPEIFDYLIAKKDPSLGSIQHGFHNVAEIEPLKKMLENVLVYNTINSPSVFFNLSNITIDNDLKQIVATNDVSNISQSILSKDTTLTYFKLSDLFTSDQLISIAASILTSVDNTFIAGDRIGIVHDENHSFNIKLTDKAGRKFIFPLLTFSIQYFGINSARTIISEALLNNCCLYVDNYQVLIMNHSVTPQTLLLDLKKLTIPPEQNMIINIRCSNSIVNTAISKDIRFTITLTPSQILQLAANSIVDIDLKEFSNQIDDLIINWHFEDTNHRATKINSNRFDWKRKICTLPIILSN